MNIKISVLTPCWNRSKYLYKVWHSLLIQSYKNFEWIIANDGSEDNIHEIIEFFTESKVFPIILIDSNIRIGKARIDNEAVSCARGDFILWCDSDDYLLPNSLAILLETWNSIPEDERGEFAGITALCIYNGSILDNIFLDRKYVDITWNDLFFKMKYDFVLFCRADELKNNPFREVDFVIPETSVWNKIGVKKTRFIPIPLKVVNYCSDNCISYSGLMEYNRGRAYALADNWRLFLNSERNHTRRIVRLINFYRYCYHGDIDLFNAFRLLGDIGAYNLLLPVIIPIAHIISIRDRVQGKVRKTHRQFEEARLKVNIKKTFFD